MYRRFSPSEEAAIAGLREYWDAWLGGQPGSDVTPRLEDSLSSTVRRIHALDDTPGASPEFAERLFAQLGVRQQTDGSRGGKPAIESALAGAHPPVRSRFAPKPSASLARAHRLKVAIAAGACLLIVLGFVAGYATWSESRQDQTYAVISAPSESSASQLTVETLFELSIPAGQLPDNSRNQIGAGEFVVEPGETIVDGPPPCLDAPELSFGLVESGSITLHAPSEVELTRTGGVTEVLAAGAEAQLKEGDAWVYQRDKDEPQPSLTNDGTVPSHLLRGSWWLGESCAKAGLMLLWGESRYAYDFDRTRSVSISVSRVTLPKGTVLSHEEAEQIGVAERTQDIFVVAGVESGSLQESWVQGDQAVPDAADVQMHLVDTSTAGNVWTIDLNVAPPEGMIRKFSAGVEEPLVLTIFAFAYDDAG